MKNLKNLGAILNKEEQQAINGGATYKRFCQNPSNDGLFCGSLGRKCCHGACIAGSIAPNGVCLRD